MYKIHLLLIVCLLSLTACSTTDYSRSKTKTDPPINSSEKKIMVKAPSNVDTPEVIEEPIETVKVITTASLNKPRISSQKSAPPASRKVVLDLLAQSKLAMEETHYQNAESLLKRALRIEPSNAWLWHNMAVLKFYQEDYKQAIQQALKSNNLEKNNPQLKENNSKVIKQSYIELGDLQQAELY
jgi:tetratricopeptide (TPR) repeat protein